MEITIPATFEELTPQQKEEFARIGFEVFKAKFCKVEVAKQSQELSRLVDTINTGCQQTIESQLGLNCLSMRVKE